jgi:branched-chain amino acid transport system ATP-binding protein
VLVARDLSVAYGGVRAVSGLSLSVAPGQVVALLGPNGAGKTSALRAISGLCPHQGTVTVDGLPVSDPAAARRAGVVHVPQGRGLFRRLTVAQNLSLGAYGQPGPAMRAALSEAEAVLPELRGWWRRRVGTLSGGEQVLVALGRLVAGRPAYALLDEPALGLSPVAVDRLYAELSRLAGAGVGILLVEQYAARALALADRVVVVDRGRVTFEGTAAEAGEAGDLVAAYLAARR